MPQTNTYIAVVRSSHDRFVGLVSPLSEAEVEKASYAKDWSIAQVASHLGSQAEIFQLALEAGLSGAPAPGRELFGPIWERWNSSAPMQQVRESVEANETLVSRIEHTSADERDKFGLSMFGMELDFAGLLGTRLGEHALHTWDIAVALDDAATVSGDAVELIVDHLGALAARAGTPVPDVAPVSVVTSSPARTFRLSVHPTVTLEAATESESDPLTLPAEALVRLVYGRLDEDHTPPGVEDPRLPVLRTVFPGF